MARRWIEWIPDTEVGVLQQLMHEAGKHAGVIWLIDPPPTMRVSCTPVELEAIKHYMTEGGLPVGWIDLQGFVHSFVLKPPFDPPNFKLEAEGLSIPYGFHFSKDF